MEENSLEGIQLFVDSLESLEVPYMFVGAFSSNAYGIPRATKDADIVVQITPEQLGKLKSSLGPGFRFDAQLSLEGFTGTSRNVIKYSPTNFEIELFRYEADDEHHVERFRRRRRIHLIELQREVWIPTAEDVIIQKLRWFRQKDREDVRDVLAVSGSSMDWNYLELWTRKHGTSEMLAKMWDSVEAQTDFDEVEESTE